MKRSNGRWSGLLCVWGALLMPRVGVADTPAGSTGWSIDGSGAWASAGNWTGGIPTQDTVALLGSAGEDAQTARTVTLGGNSAAWEILFDGSADYAISGSAYTLTVGKSGGNYEVTTRGDITVTGGTHVIDVSQVNWYTSMNEETLWKVDGGASLRVTGAVNIPANHVCCFDGGGTIRIDGLVATFDGYGGGVVRGNTTLEVYGGLLNGPRRPFTVGAGSTLRGDASVLGSLNTTDTSSPSQILLNGILDPVGFGGVGTGTLVFGTYGSKAGARVRVYLSSTQEMRFALGSTSDKITTANAAAAGTLEIYGRTSGTTTLRLDPGVGALLGTPYDLVDLSGADAVSSFDIGDFSVVNNLAYGATLQWDATGKVLQCVVAVPKGTTITIR